MVAATKGGKLQAGAFKDLDVEFKNADGSLRSVEDVLIDAGSALANLDDDAKASALSVQLLGPAGAALVPAFNKGAVAVRQLTAELRENVSLNAEEVDRLDAVGKAVERGTKKWKALKDRVVVALLPLLQKLAAGFEKVSKWILRMAKETQTLQAIFAALAGLGIARLITLFGAWVVKVGGARAAMLLLGNGLRAAAVAAARFVLPLLLIEDFFTFLAGGKSLFGRAFEEIFGSGGAQKAREEILAAFQAIGRVLREEVAPIIKEIATNPFFTGAVAGAVSVVLSLLNLIGMAFTDDIKKLDELGERFFQNSARITNLIDGLIAKVKELGQAIANVVSENLPKIANAASYVVPGGLGVRTGISVAQKVGGWFSDKVRDVKNFASGPGIPHVPMGGTPMAPSSSKAVNLTDQRKIEINVGANSAPGAVGRAVGGAVDGALIKDRRQTLNAL
jgi:hypothetical protein